MPRGFTRFLGTVSSITDSGIPVHFFTGNHDMWIRDYLSKECGMVLHTEPLIKTFNGKRFYLAHGEGRGSENTGLRILLKIFHNKPLRVLYSALHPSLGVGYELGLAESLNKSVLCLYYSGNPKPLSAMIAGNTSYSIKMYSSISEVKVILKEFFEQK